MVAGAFFFSVMSALVKLAGQRLPIMEVVLARGVVTFVLSYGVLRYRGVPVLGNDRRGLLVRGLLGFIALNGFFYAVIHLPLADATVIHYTNPVFTALIAAVVLEERLRTREVALSLISLVGVVLVARPGFLFGEGGGGLPAPAVAAGLMAAIVSGGAYVTIRRVSRTDDPMVIVFYFAAVSVVGALPFLAYYHVWPTTSEWLILLGIGLATQAGQVFLTLGLRAERAGRAMSVGYVQILFAALWGVLLFGHVPDRWAMLGGVVIVCSTLLLSRTGRRSGPEGPARLPA